MEALIIDSRWNPLIWVVCNLARLGFSVCVPLCVSNACFCRFVCVPFLIWMVDKLLLKLFSLSFPVREKTRSSEEPVWIMQWLCVLLSSCKFVSLTWQGCFAGLDSVSPCLHLYFSIYAPLSLCPHVISVSQIWAGKKKKNLAKPSGRLKAFYKAYK